MKRFHRWRILSCLAALGALCAPAWAAPALADAYRGTPTYDRALIYYHSPVAVQKDKIIAKLREVSAKLQVPMEVYDTSKDENFAKLVKIERERVFPRAGHSVLLAGWRVAVDHWDILALLDDLAAGKVSLDDPPPEIPEGETLSHVASGGKFTSIVDVPRPDERETTKPEVAFPPYGSWTLAAALACVGVFAGAFLASRGRGPKRSG